MLAEAYTLYQRRLQGGARARLRRPDHGDGAPAPVAPGRRRALPAPVPPRAGRRVPGHQPRAVRAGQGAGAATTGELCVVGDADQSIYAFRGATIRNILEFERDYPDARTILLEQNYRSTQTILNAANAVINRNTDRKPKNLWSDQGAGRADRRVRRRHRARRGRLGGPRDRPARRRRAGPAGRRGGVLPHQRPVPGLRGDLHPARPAVQGRRRGALLRAQGGPRRAGLPARRSPTPTTR